MVLRKSTSIGFLSIGSLLLICISARADFGTAITFEESTYTVYNWSEVQEWADSYDPVTNSYSIDESTISSSTLTVSDDQVIGLGQAFRVTTSSDNV
jgi:hypothetical protein